MLYGNDYSWRAICNIHVGPYVLNRANKEIDNIDDYGQVAQWIKQLLYEMYADAAEDIDDDTFNDIVNDIYTFFHPDA